MCVSAGKLASSWRQPVAQWVLALNLSASTYELWQYPLGLSILICKMGILRSVTLACKDWRAWLYSGTGLSGGSYWPLSVSPWLA